MFKSMHKTIIALVALVLASQVSVAQDPEFTQFYANQIYLNPAFAGNAKGPRVAVNYRNMWPSVPQANFITYAVSYDQHFDKIGGGIAFQALYDIAGENELITNMGSFAYAYHLNLGPKFTIKASLQAAVQSKTLDFSKLVFGDMLDARRGIVSATAENIPSNGIYKMDPFMDLSAGIIGFNRQFYGGFAVNHINKPKQTWLSDPKAFLERKYTAHVGMMIPLENVRYPERFFSPNILFQKQGNFMQFNIGGYYIKDMFLAGVWFRQTSENFDALELLVGVRKGPLKIGYSYDITFSDARFGAVGSHEISLIMEFEQNRGRRRSSTNKWRKIDCPDF